MSILDTRMDDNKYRYGKTVIVFLLFSAFAFAVNKVYSLFGHGVKSDAMTWMFLYPLILGGLFYLLIGFLLPGMICFTGYRLFYNLYNSGIAVFTIGSLLKGIFEIAGTSSPYLKLFFMTGYVMIGAGVLIFVILILNYKRSTPKELTK